MSNSKRVLITGGTTGIGMATAQLFLDDGHRVMITGRNPETLASAREKFGADVHVVSADVREPSEIDKLYDAVREVWHGLDVLFVNAGRNASMLPIAEMDVGQWDDIMNINLRGAVLTIKGAIPHMSEGGSIVVNTSIANEMADPGDGAYGASKAALRSIVRTAAAQLAEAGIRVNAVSPGPVSTPIWDKVQIPEESRAEVLEQFRQMVPQKRFGDPKEIAAVVRFFASDDASFVTGTELRVAGGLGDC